MADVRITVSELQAAAMRFKQHNETIRNAAAALKAAADALADTWEGEAHEVFVAEQEQINQWYETMHQITEEFVITMDSAARDYQDMDEQSAQIINKG